MSLTRYQHDSHKESYLSSVLRLQRKRLKLVVLENKILLQRLTPGADVEVDVRAALIGGCLHYWVSSRNTVEPCLKLSVIAPLTGVELRG